MATEWPTVTIGDVAEVFDGPHATPKKISGGPIFLGISALDRGRLNLSNTEHLSEEDFTQWTRRVTPRAGDIVFSYETRLGEAALIPEGLRCCLGRRMGLVRAQANRLDSRFFLYQYLSPAFQAFLGSRTIHGSTVDRIPLIDFPDFPIALPPIDEQRAIAHILGTLDDKIELDRRMNETLEGIARAIFKSWFVDFDPVRAKASGEAPESICQRLGLTPDLLALFPDRLVDSELGEIPEEWETTALRSIADVTKGKSYKSSELGPSRTALVTLKSFNRGGGYRLDGLKEYTGTFRREQEVFAGDLIVAYTDVTQAADVVGKPALIVSDSRYEHLVISLDVAVIRPRLLTYRPFLYGLMSNEAFQQHTRAHTTGTTVLHLAAGAVPGFNFLWPGERLVEEYSALAQPIFELMDRRVGEARSLESTRDALLPKLLTGQLRIPIEGDV